PRHAPRAPPRADRSAAAREQADPPRRGRDRPAVRRRDARAAARAEDPMTTRTELNTLEQSGLVQVAALEPELEYLFRHALVQDAAYSSLLKQDRRALHRLAADTLLSLYPERRGELAAVIGLHLERAGTRRPPLSISWSPASTRSNASRTA